MSESLDNIFLGETFVVFFPSTALRFLGGEDGYKHDTGTNTVGFTQWELLG